jgi:hypothetical protein
MVTAMLTVENILDDAGHDVWAVNVEADYHEETAAPGTGTDTPAADAAGSTPAVGTGRSAPVRPRRRPRAA